MQHGIVQDFLPDVLFITVTAVLFAGAGVVAVSTACAACALVTDQGCAADGTVGNPRQRVDTLCAGSAALVVIEGNTRLHGVEEVTVDDRLDGVLGADALCFIDAYVLLVAEDAAQAVFIKLSAPAGAQALGVQCIADGLDLGALGVLLVDPAHVRGRLGVGNEFLFPDHQAKRGITAQSVAFIGTLGHAATDFLG